MDDIKEINPTQQKCPECESIYLAELASVDVATDIDEWENFEPKEYGYTEIFWDSSRILDPKYLCRQCGHEFNLKRDNV